MKDFAAIDFETANQCRSSVCSVGVVIVNDNKMTAPAFPEVWEKVRVLIGDLPLVAHNSPFDEGCLKAVFGAYGMTYPGYRFYCTCRASRAVLGNRLPNHQLQTVAQYCGYDLKHHHHALADAEACARIAIKLAGF